MKLKSKQPLVTIITPTFNRADFLEETIKSVLSQSYKNIEYIVLDDGSIDDTAKIEKKFKDKLIWKHHKNIGEVRTVNKGLRMAQGDIIGVVNSDDPLLPGAIKEMVKALVDNPKIIVAYSDWVYINEKGEKIRKNITANYNYENMIATHNCPLGASAFFKKEILETLVGRNIRFKYVSDYDFWLRAGLIGKFIRIPKILVASRIHPGQATITGRSFRAAMDHITVIKNFFDLPNLPPHVRKLKAKAYENACIAARICRGDKLSAKIFISLACLYYSPLPYIKLFIKFRFKKLQKVLQI